jgi:hypothetical protein
VELSPLEALGKDEEFVLYRGQQWNPPGSPPVLLLAPASIPPALETLRKIEHEYSLRDEPDSVWAILRADAAMYRTDRLRRSTALYEKPFRPVPTSRPIFLPEQGIAKPDGELVVRLALNAKTSSIDGNPTPGKLRRLP